jgi:hypothetical protein
MIRVAAVSRIDFLEKTKDDQRALDEKKVYGLRKATVTFVDGSREENIFIDVTLATWRGPKQEGHLDSEMIAAMIVNHEAPPGKEDARPQPDLAEAAAEQYRKTSLTIKKEEIRQGYKPTCARIATSIAKKFGLANQWAEVNHLTRMVEVNLGDVDAFARAESEFPGAAVVAVRVLVAFETLRERPMYMSYVMIGRKADGQEVMALYNDAKEWTVLSGRDAANSEKILSEAAEHELTRLTDKIALDIRRLH